MNCQDPCYAKYLQILREELQPAMGCTEPIAIAYAAAKVRSVLGALPDRLDVAVSGNIIKNVKSVVIPHTDCGAVPRPLRQASWRGIRRGNWRSSPM